MSIPTLNRVAHPLSDEELLNEAQERIDALCTSEQARLILTGLAANGAAKRALALAASFDERQAIPKIAMGRLLALPRNRFLQLYESLQLCGALVPLPLDDRQFVQLADQLTDTRDHIVKASDPVAEVLIVWRKQFGDTLNPALGLSMREEMDSA